MYGTTVFLAVLSLFASISHAHMVINSPVPYGASSLTNGPIAADGSDFPCKQRSGVYDITTMNSMAVGVPQTLAFTGSAVHGGGSCQVSVSLDEQPSKNSQWKVIHSIIGGCPSNVTGNLEENAAGHGAAAFQYSLPSGFPNGKATLAWTWLNKVGNREFYMNCAPIDVSGGSDSHDVYNSLPDMFVANIPATTCGTTENEDFVYPNPGANAQTMFSTALGSKTIGSSCQQATDGSGNAGTAAAQATTTAALAMTAPQYTTLSTTNAAAAGSQTGIQSMVLPTIASTPGGTEAGSNTMAQASTFAAGAAPSPYPYPNNANNGQLASAATESATPTSTAAGSAGNASVCPVGSSPCTGAGTLNCYGTDSFGLCDLNNCAVKMAVAAGTECVNGAISLAANAHARRHLRRGIRAGLTHHG